MKNIIFLLCIFAFILFNSIIEPLELLPLEQVQMSKSHIVNKPNIPVYPPPKKYKEPSVSKYINPYNMDIQHNLFIQCKHNYNKIPKQNMCPKELPICKGNKNQLGFCNESNISQQNLDSYNVNMLSCKNSYSLIPKQDMCPYNLPYCEYNICKENSLFYNR